MTELTVRSLDRHTFEPYGWVLGLPIPSGAPAATFCSAASDFWQAHLFDCGESGQTEVLWVAYRDATSAVTTLEQHLLTQQALIPLTGELLQFVAANGTDGKPDLPTLAAFRVSQGQGICMRPGCWHSTRTLQPGEVRCAMLTRRSTTLDLVRYLSQHKPAVESVVALIAPHSWRVV